MRVTVGTRTSDDREYTCLGIICQGFAPARSLEARCRRLLAYTRRMSNPALPLPGVAAPPAPAKDVRSLAGLMPFLRPYRLRIGLAVLFLVMAAISTLVFPVAMKSLIDQGFVT